MNNLLHFFLSDPNFEKIISDFHDEVKNTDLVKHYFLAAKKTAIMQDLKKYYHYLTPKSEYEYSIPPTSTSKWEIQLPSNQFQEVTQILATELRKNKIQPVDAQQLQHEILEIVEETRSQCNETEVSKLDVVEITPEKIYQLLRRNSIISEVMPSKAVKTERGLPHPVWIQTDYENKTLHVSSKIIIKEAASQTDIDELLEKIRPNEKFIHLRMEQGDVGPRYLTDGHDIPFNDGIPIRLFTRYLKRFSGEFDKVFGSDSDNILSSSKS
jgi:hypothetical protein